MLDDIEDVCRVTGMDRSGGSVYRRVGDDSEGGDVLVGGRRVGFTFLGVLLHLRPPPVLGSTRVKSVPAKREKNASVWEKELVRRRKIRLTRRTQARKVSSCQG